MSELSFYGELFLEMHARKYVEVSFVSFFLDFEIVTCKSSTEMKRNYTYQAQI